jgi:hypothetical protein
LDDNDQWSTGLTLEESGGEFGNVSGASLHRGDEILENSFNLYQTVLASKLVFIYTKLGFYKPHPACWG